MRAPARLHRCAVLTTLPGTGLPPEANEAIDPDEAVALGAAVQVGCCLR
jgi:molecular chaperone DnaK (HSP70)